MVLLFLLAFSIAAIGYDGIDVVEAEPIEWREAIRVSKLYDGDQFVEVVLEAPHPQASSSTVRRPW